MFIMDVLDVSWKAVGDFLINIMRYYYYQLVLSATPASTTAYQPQLEGRILFVC